MSALARAQLHRRRCPKENALGNLRSIAQLSEDVGLLLGAPLVTSIASVILILLNIAKVSRIPSWSTLSESALRRM